MTKSNDLLKAAAAGVKTANASPADPKKVKTLREAFPFLSDEEAGILLQEYHGSVKLASEAAINGERWKKIKVKKPKREDKTAPAVSPVAEARPERTFRKDKEFNSNKDGSAPRPSREKKDSAKPADKADKPVAPKETEVKTATIHQTGISTSSWSKGGVSFAEMLKKQSAPATATAPAEAAPAAPSPKVAEEPKAKKEKKVDGGAAAPAAAPELAAAAAAPAPTAAAPAPAPEVSPATEVEVAKKPRERRERKPRNVDAASSVEADASKAPAAPTPAAAAPATAAAPAVAAPAPSPTAPAAPRITKYVLEFDRITETVALPSHVVELAQRFGNTYTFDGAPGRAPTPPQPPVASAPPQQHNFTMLPTRQSWNGPESNNMPQRMNQPINSHWDTHTASAWGRPGPSNFTSYQSPYQQTAPYRQPNQGMGYRYSNHHNVHSHHHQRHPEQVASDAAYSAIRDDQAQNRFNAGVW